MLGYVINAQKKATEKRNLIQYVDPMIGTAKMGHTYPGPGSTIGPAGVFGYIGALHASQPAQNPHID